VLPLFTIDEVKKALAAANDRLLQEGITCVQDAWAGWIAPREFKGYQDAVKEGLLQVRVILIILIRFSEVTSLSKLIASKKPRNHLR
jgi:hypothetical protein